MLRVQLLPVSQHGSVPGNGRGRERRWWRRNQGWACAGNENNVAGVAIARVAIDDAANAAATTMAADMAADIAATAAAPGCASIHQHLVAETLGEWVLVYLELGESHIPVG